MAISSQLKNKRCPMSVINITKAISYIEQVCTSIYGGDKNPQGLYYSMYPWDEMTYGDLGGLVEKYWDKFILNEDMKSFQYQGAETLMRELMDELEDCSIKSTLTQRFVAMDL